MDFKELSKSRVCREFIKELLADEKGHLASELKIYVKKRAVEEEIVQDEDDITSGIFSRACQDTLEKEKRRYTRDENGYYKMVVEEIPFNENEEISINYGIIKILEDTVKKLNKELVRKNQLELTKEDFETIQKVKPIIDFIKEKVEVIKK
ncbi:hypothetical protein FC764_16925 [Clostridium botulinum]|nr:hypothetical protein [Clostridium botulinum]